MKTTLRIFTAGCLSMMMIACSSGGGSDSSASNTNNNGSNNDSQGTSPETPVPDVDLKGFVDGGSYDKVQTFDFDKTTGELIVNLPLGIDSSVLIGSATIPQLPDVRFYTMVGPDGSAYFVMRIPVRHFVRGVTTLPAGRLPNGDALPLMPAGDLPAAAFPLNPSAPNGKKAVLYLGVDAIGLYVESKWLSCGGLPICINPTFPIKNSAKTKVVGYFHVMMPKNSKDGGFFISTVIPPNISKILDEHFID